MAWAAAWEYHSSTMIVVPQVKFVSLNHVVKLVLTMKEQRHAFLRRFVIARPSGNANKSTFGVDNVLELKGAKGSC